MKSNRRAFLGQAGTLALGVSIIPRHVLGRGFQAPSDTMQLGFIGTGKQGRGLMRAFASRATVVAGADVDAQKLALFQSLLEKAYQEKPNPAFKKFTPYADFRKILDRKDIDAVVIATPDHWHAVMSIMAADAKKHVYCEKPLAHSVEEGRAMVKAMQKTGMVLQTGSMQRSNKNFRRACELVQSGYIGKVKEVWVSVGDPAIPCNLPQETKPATLNWEGWMGPAPERPFNAELSPPVEKDIFPNWRLYREYGGGMVSDWGAHMFDIAQWGLGMDRSGPVQFIPPAKGETRGLKMIYANGVEMTHKDFGRKYGVRFIGEKGRIDVSREYFDSDPVDLATKEPAASDVKLYDSPDHYYDWLNAIKSGRPPICDVETGHRTSSVCCLANISYWLNKPLTWNPDTEQFTDADANALVKANIRGKWKLV